MALPTTNEIVATLRPPKTLMGPKSFADYAPPNPQDVPDEVLKGIQRMSLYDTSGELVPKDFKSSLGIAAPVPEHTTTPMTAKPEEGTGAFVMNALDMADRLHGAISEAVPRGVAEVLQKLPKTKFNVGKNTVEFDPAGAQEYASRNLEPQLSQLYRSLQESGVTGIKENAGLISLAGGIVADPFGLPGGPSKKVLARAIELAQKSSQDTVPAIFAILRKAGAEEGLAKDYAKALETADFKKIEEGIASLDKIQSTSKITPKKTVEELGKDALKREAGGFEGFNDISVSTLEKMRGRKDVSKQYIMDLANQPDLKQPERLLIRKMLEDEGDKVDVPKFANKVKTELLPLKRGLYATGDTGRYESINLPSELRGPVANYKEHIYESPITTSAGSVHFGGKSKNYFAHTRVEDLPAVGEERYLGDIAGGKKNMVRGKDGLQNNGDTRRVIELQSDLFQKGRLEGETRHADEILSNPTYKEENAAAFNNPEAREAIVRDAQSRKDEVSKLEPYRNTWHERVIREEVKKAAEDGKTKLQFPTGETAMKIEGLNSDSSWTVDGMSRLRERDLRVGLDVAQGDIHWVITDVLGDGKFKAVPKHITEGTFAVQPGDPRWEGFNETFDISGNVDTSNPIYKFYEKEVKNFLVRKYGAHEITDPQGVSWIQMNVKPEYKNVPIQAFGAGAGFQPDEEGNITFDPKIAALGLVGGTVARNPKFVKAVSAEKMVGPMKDLLGAAYKKVSDSVRTVFAKKLVDLKRESDIEGLLSTLQRLDNQADKAGQMTLDATMPVSVREVLSPKQAKLDIELLTRKLGQTGKEDEKLHAATRNEYDALWEEADQKVVDRFNNANIERGIVEEILSSHPAEVFTQFRLPGTSWGEFSLAELQNKGMKTGGKGKSIDIYVSEAGYKDLEDAQQGLEDYLALKQSLKDIKEEIKELKPRVKSAQVVRGILDGLPIIPTKDASEVDNLITSATVRDFNDISGTMGEFRDPDRNFQRFFGGYHYPKAKRLFLDPLDDGKRALGEGIKERRQALKTTVTDKYKINRGGEEAAAIQDWGERGLMGEPATANPNSKYHTEEALVKKFGLTKAREIQRSADWFRGVYDKAIEESNNVLRKIYPNNPAKLIPYRKDYFHHFRELGDGFMDAIRNFTDVPSGIDPKLVGISEFTKPKEKFKAFAQTRTGPRSQRDAIEGYLRFMEGVEYLKHIEPHISKFRYLRRKIAEVAPKPGVEENMQVQEGVNNFLQFLDNYSNDLAGKTAPADRYIQNVMPGGRSTMKVLNFVMNRIKANTMLGNQGTTIAQMANIPAVVAETKQHVVEGMKRTLAGIFDPNALSKQSTFLRERFQESYKSEFPISFKEHPIKRSEEETAKVLAWVLKSGDRIGTELAWNSFFEKYMAENPSGELGKAMRFADNKTKRLVAGRGIGELPIAQKAKTIQALMPFTVETNNAWFWLGDQARAKGAFGTIATYLLAQYMFNEAAERTRGSRVSWDPINAILEGSDTFMKEAQGGNIMKGAEEFAGRQAGEALSNIGGGQLISSMLPDSIMGLQKTDLFGQGDPNRFGPPVLFAGALSDPLTRFALPFGGVQAKKTWNGVQALLQGEAKSKSGKTNFPIAQTPANIVRAIAFGPNATSEARNSFGTGDKLHQMLSMQSEDSAKLGLEAEQKWDELKKMKKEGGDPAAEWNRIKKENPELFDKLKDISKQPELTSNERLIKMLNVSNGARAQYIYDQIQSLKTKEEKQELWKEYVAKKILTDEVKKQVTELLKN